LLVRGDLLRRLGGFDERFFYHFEEVDLCKRVWGSGSSILFTPEASITHLGHSVGHLPIRHEIEKHRNRYRYFYKHYGKKGSRQCRTVTLAWLRVRQLGYSLINLITSSAMLRKRLEMYRAVIRWNATLDPVRFVESGEEPVTDLKPVAQPL
jgi:hypothetical protein